MLADVTDGDSVGGHGARGARGGKKTYRYGSRGFRGRRRLRPRIGRRVDGSGRAI